jgi:hypothetical protein
MTNLLSRHFPLRLLALVTVAALGVAGCDRAVKKVTIHGTVTYQGQPVRSGMLKFVGPGGATSGAVIQPDGSFIITDVVPGEVKVGVVQGPQSSGSSSGEEGTKAKEPPVSLPDKYRDPETSGVSYTITPETKELPIEIK